MRSLARRHRATILGHLLALTPHDRYLRFGYQPIDDRLREYVHNLHFERDEVFGVFNRRLVLVGWAHLAFESPGEHFVPSCAEFGVSTLSSYRGRGIGERLFRHAMLRARNRGIDTLVVHALSENAAMLRLAARAGAQVQRDGADASAHLKLPAESLASRLDEAFEAAAGEFDYQLKLHRREKREGGSGDGAVSEPFDTH